MSDHAFNRALEAALWDGRHLRPDDLSPVEWDTCIAYIAEQCSSSLNDPAPHATEAVRRYVS